jgi:hypothetical protein
METGLLWYDGDPKRSLKDKVERAAEHYRSKLGVRPNTCFVNSAMMAERSMEYKGMRIVSAGDVLPGHFWLGVVRSDAKKRKRAHHRVDKIDEAERSPSAQ